MLSVRRTLKLVIPLCVVAIALLIYCFPNPGRTAEKIKERFAQLEPRLAQACRVNGQFLRKLPPDWQQEMSGLCAHWWYRGEQDHYAVSFGVYSKDGFYLSWDSKDREWFCDQ